MFWLRRTSKKDAQKTKEVKDPGPVSKPCPLPQYHSDNTAKTVLMIRCLFSKLINPDVPLARYQRQLNTSLKLNPPITARCHVQGQK